MTMSNTPADMQNKQPEPAKTAAPRRPNELGAISVRAHLRIFDPKTEKTIVETQG